MIRKYSGSGMAKAAQRIASVFMVLAVVLTMISFAGFPALAESEADVTSDGFTFHLWYGSEGASVALQKYSGSDTQVILPGSVTYGGKTYKASDDSNWFMLDSSTFAGNTKITKIAIPDGYRTIEEDSFKGCTSLKEIAVGDSVEYVSENAFRGSSCTTYYIKGDKLSEEQIKNSGIGIDASGNPAAGVVVYTVKGGTVDKVLQELNEGRTGGYRITIQYADDPYSKNTVTPSGSGSSSGGSSMGTDGTAYGKGASETAAEKAATSWKKESDPKGTVFAGLQASATAKKTKVTLKWKKVSGARKYVIYGNACGAKNKLKKIVKGTAKTSQSFKKVAGKKVKKGTYYKFMVVAVDKNGKVISSSKIVHVATSGGKVGNDKKVKTAAKKNKVAIKVKKSFKLKAKPVAASKSLKVKRHRGISYESTNPKIASVTSKGVIKGKAKGTCYVYAYAQNGVFAKIKVTVKK